MNTAFLSLGGNLGDRRENLRRALAEVEKHCGSIEKKSSVYETAPWESDSKLAFLNMAVKVKTALSARELIERVLMIEEKLGRKRTGFQNSDRNIDIDILFYDKAVRSVKGLELPHPRLHQRKFVLVPLKEIAPTFVHPVLKKNISQLLNACEDRLSVKKVKDRPACQYICIEGNIGSGKTTLAKALARELKAEFVAESFEENNLLPLFYKNRKNFAFPLEYSFLIARFDQLKKVFREVDRTIVSDYIFQKSLWFANVNLPRKAFLFFRKHFEDLQNEVRQPDLVVYLQTSPQNLKKNIAARGRSYEKGIKKSYLRALESAYLKGLKKLNCQVLVLDIEDYDGEPEKLLCKKIKKYIAENFG